MRKKLNIALIRKKYLHGRGGAEKIATRFVNGFTEHGHSISLFSEVFDGTESDRLRWIRVPKDIFPALCGTVSFHRQVQALLLRPGVREGFDVIYSMCRTFPVDIFRVTEQLHVKWMPMGYSRMAMLNPRHRGILQLEKKTFTNSGAGMVVASSKFLRRQIIEEFDFPRENIRVIYNGLNHDRFYPAGMEEKGAVRKRLKLEQWRHICLFCAGNFRIKGLAQAIRVIAAVRAGMRDNTLLLVVGGDNEAPFARLADECGVRGNVIFAGARSNMRDYYTASDILLYPSHYETFSNVCLEALACGLPVITTRQIGAHELVKHGENGFLVDESNNIHEMANYLSSFMKLPLSARRKFSFVAADSVRGFTWQRHTEQLEQLFYEVASLKSGKIKR